MTEEVRITIVGAGVVGCAIAYELSKDFNENIVVIEKNSQINGENQSSRNSGVIHAGIFYSKDFSPLKSKLCIEGNRLLYDFCEKNNVAFKKTGKLVIATENIELEYLDDVFKTANENGVEGIKYLDQDEIKRFEPNVSGIAALYVPSSGIVESTQLVTKLYKVAESNGVIFLTENELIDAEYKNSFFNITVKSRNLIEKFKTKILINSAGLYSDQIAKMLNKQLGLEIEPIKGDYAKFYCNKRPDIHLNGLNIYPVPFGYYPNGERAVIPFQQFLELFKQDKVTKSLGVHLSPTFDFSAYNPNSIYNPKSISNKSIGKELLFNYKNNTYNIGSTVLIGPAYSKPQNKEDYKNSRKEEYFYNMIKPFFPNIMLDDISIFQTGIRAKLKNLKDFVIEADSSMHGLINLIGIDSPGLTSSLAIAKYIRNVVKYII